MWIQPNLFKLIAIDPITVGRARSLYWRLTKHFPGISKLESPGHGMQVWVTPQSRIAYDTGMITIWQYIKYSRRIFHSPPLKPLTSAFAELRLSHLRGQKGVSFRKVFSAKVKVTHYLTFQSFLLHISYKMTMWHCLKVKIIWNPLVKTNIKCL